MSTCNNAPPRQRSKGLILRYRRKRCHKTRNLGTQTLENNTGDAELLGFFFSPCSRRRSVGTFFGVTIFASFTRPAVVPSGAGPRGPQFEKARAVFARICAVPAEPHLFILWPMLTN